MRRFCLLLLVFGFITGTETAAAEQGKLEERLAQTRCGVFPGPIAYYDVTARNVSCRVARRVTRQWERKLLNGSCERFRCRARAFLCVARRPATITYRVNCRRGIQRVAWTISVD